MELYITDYCNVDWVSDIDVPGQITLSKSMVATTKYIDEYS